MPKPPPGSIPGQIPSDVMSMMEEGMMQKAQGQKTAVPTAIQQSTSGSAQSPTNLVSTSQANFQHQQTPRDVGSFTDEAKAAVTDVAEGLFNFPLDILKNILGLNRDPKTPEEKAKLQQFHQGWQQLSQEQQQVAQQRLQAEAQRKEMMQQQEEAKKQQEEEMKKQQSIDVPHGKVSGQAALDKMQQDRKGMGGASG